MSDSTLPKTLIQKLAEACDAVGGIEKKGRNTMQNYDYVRAADVAKAIRHELFSRGVVILADEQTPEWREFQTAKGSIMRECTLRVTYHITDGSQEILMNAYGVAMDSGDKAIYKSKTGALKYFLRCLGLIPDEKDDPEHDSGGDKSDLRKPKETMADKALMFHFGQIDAAQTQETLFAAFKEAYKDAQALDDKAAMAAFIKAKDAKKVIIGNKTPVEAVAEPQEAFLEPEPPQTPTQPSAGPKKGITEKQIARLFAIAKQHSIPEDDIRRYVKEGYGFDHLHDLNRLQYDHVCNWLESA